jgi:hypothetical protein
MNMNCEKSDLFHKIHHLLGDTEGNDQNTVRAVGPSAERRTCKLQALVDILRLVSCKWQNK